ncbi:MAG: aminotransferase class I/II-fold pyridoxal phosphate-dependent enzyme, partial [Anaerolineales bacterium]|nr:aminotransferase class I/II-fold pyridoxal phosphate-dependent enzyme [Anaerolineales bacterium]
INQAILDPGDLALVPQPAYPTYRVGARFSGAEVYFFPLLEENRFLPDLEAIPADIADRAKVIWLNYPNNPTGAIADRDYFSSLVDFAHRHNLLIFHDAPYMEIYYGDVRPPSLLEIPGAKDISIEFNSLSKTYNMAGWRVGMAVGNQDLVKYLHSVKMQIDTSNYLPIQSAAELALTGDQSWILERNLVYQQRLGTIIKGLRGMGIETKPPEAAIYVWFRLPDGLDDRTFCDEVLESTGVSVTPGSIYGESGEGYVRISLCTPNERIEEAMQRLHDWVKVEI